MLRASERGVNPRPHVFAREHVGRSFLVTLTSIDLREQMPVRQWNWSMSFLDEQRRDVLFGWLAERVHRWDGLGGLTLAKEAGALTAYPLALLFAHPVGPREAV